MKLKNKKSNFLVVFFLVEIYVSVEIEVKCIK